MIKKVSANTITDDFLKGYQRYQETKNVLFLQDGKLLEKEDQFTESWDESKLIEISKYLRDLVKKGGVVYAAYSGKHVIGFSCIDYYQFGDYINLPYIHTDSRYRGQGYGKELILFAGLEAMLKGAKKLYISSHPAVETQKFYESVGCTLAEEVNETLLAIEPYDIQLELKLSYELLIELLQIYLRKHKKSAVYFGKLASRFYRFLPKDDVEFLEVIKKVNSVPTLGMYSIATLWLKRRESVLVGKYLSFYEELLDTVVIGWARVDQLCYRALNPVIESGDYYSYLDKWSYSDNPSIRRTSLVAMVRSSVSQTLGYDYDKMITLVERLKNDEDYHVRKGVGWVLKVAYPTYPKKVEAYLREHYKTLDRMIYRYALEHVKDPLRAELLELK
jgi:3-methyladenine DNA glycosylase AlkD/GNAT superfamily N-acetyltransferase